MTNDTIAAIATALSESGISIIRISGSDSINIANKVFKGIKNADVLIGADTHTVHLGYIMENEKIVDQVLATVFRNPKSYTGEDTVEINCHGGVFLTNRILEIIIEAGARLAEPGEFTKRAFLNGKLDLSEAEAVMDLIESKSELAVISSVNQLRGSLSNQIKDIRGQIIFETAFIEAALDDPEHISLDGYSSDLSIKVDNWIARIDRFLATSSVGNIIREGISTAIVGRPNAGKSSLMNLLIGSERAIVTDVEGTTRDTLEEYLRIGNYCLKLIDTAGIRDSEDIVEKIGIVKAKSAAENSDLIIFVIDGTQPISEIEEKITDFIDGKKIIVVLNKSDLFCKTTESDVKNFLDDRLKITRDYCVLPFSAAEGDGLDFLQKEIERLFAAGSVTMNSEIVVTNLRHVSLLKDARNSLCLVKSGLDMGMEEDFLSIDLIGCYKSLGAIIGEEIEDDLVETVFSKFCMGK